MVTFGMKSNCQVGLLDVALIVQMVGLGASSWAFEMLKGWTLIGFLGQVFLRQCADLAVFYFARDGEGDASGVVILVGEIS